MKTIIHFALLAGFCLSFMISVGQDKSFRAVTVPFILDHNRMLIEAEMRRWMPSGEDRAKLGF